MASNNPANQMVDRKINFILGPRKACVAGDSYREIKTNIRCSVLLVTKVVMPKKPAKTAKGGKRSKLNRVTALHVLHDFYIHDICTFAVLY